MSTAVRNFLLHPAYDNALNALVPPPSTAVSDINDNERRPAGRDGPEGGGMPHPHPVAIVVEVVVIDDGGGGVGAVDQHPPLHAAEC